jgi:hypothetical protein
MWRIPVEQQFFSLDFPSGPPKHAEFTAGPFDRRIKKGLAKPYCKSRLSLCYGYGSRRPQQIHVQVHPCSSVSPQSLACSVFVSVPGVVDTAAEDIHTFDPRFSTHPRTQILGHPSVSFYVQIESIL